jgi:Uma2 family endonuclease
MSTALRRVPPLIDGQKLSRAEFMRRYEAMPHVKKAELIGGIVHIPTPVSRTHGTRDIRLSTWLATYAAFTPGCEAAVNSTWLMLEDAPQPDADLRILPEYGGASREEGSYAAGAPELIGETSETRSAVDLGDKKKLYGAAGVREYLVFLPTKRELRGYRLAGSSYKLVTIPKDGILRSQVFPGLWLDVEALIQGDMAQVLQGLHKGLESPEHKKFVDHLAKRRR